MAGATQSKSFDADTPSMPEFLISEEIAMRRQRAISAQAITAAVLPGG
jgi:hypothetical protein